MLLQIRKGLNSLREATTFAEGEPVWTTDTNKLYIGDGVTPGGVLVAGGGSTGNTFTNITVTSTATVQSLIVDSVKLKAVAETVYDWGSVGAGTYTPNVNSGTVHKMLLTGNVTINSLANAVAGSNATLIVTQDGTGGRTLTSSWKFAGGAKTLTTVATATDMISVFYDGSTYYASLSRGFV